MPDDLDWLFTSHGLNEDVDKFLELAQGLEQAGEVDAAATAYDRAFGLNPDREDIAAARQRLLDQLAVTEHGIHFRYIPAGTFLMGSEGGDPDEQPVHPVRLNAFWLADVPISWSKYCELMDFLPPPDGIPDDKDAWKARQPENWVAKVQNAVAKTKVREDYWLFLLASAIISKICVSYCENETLQAYDWHAHYPTLKYQSKNEAGEWIERSGEAIFGVAPRANPDLPYAYDLKPMVAIPYPAAQAFGWKLSTETVEYRLPTEAEWEKAARGGLINTRYAWGDERPSPENCDFNHFSERFIKKSKTYPPNSYGLYAMCGGVWEITSDWYDAEYYRQSPMLNPQGPESGEEHTLRGGSWADEAEAITVSYRMSRKENGSPNIGFRLCRVAK